MTFWTKLDALFLDGLNIPSFLRLTAEQRHEAWETSPPKNKTQIDFRIDEERKRREQRDILKKEAQKIKRKLSKERKQQALLSIKGLRWDTKHCKWISDTAQENNMPRLIITPYDAAHQIVTRGVTSIKTEDATNEKVDAQIAHAVKRGGASRVVRVEVTDRDGKWLRTWKKDTQPLPEQPETKQAAAAPAPVAADEPKAAETEDTMAKRKNKKPAKSKASSKANGANGLRAGSKQETIYNLLTRKSGCTTDEALKATGWAKCGVSTWGKKFGLKVTKEKQKDGTIRYYGA